MHKLTGYPNRWGQKQGAATAAAFPAEASGVDLVELCWSPELDVVPPGLVLAGVDSLAALEWARGRRVEHVTGKAVR